MNDSKKYNPDFIKSVDKKHLDQLAGRFNLSEEELLMVEKISKNPLEMINNKSAIEMMTKTADKIFKGMSEEDKAEFEKFKKFNEKESSMELDKVKNSEENKEPDFKNSSDLNTKRTSSKKENGKN